MTVTLFPSRRHVTAVASIYAGITIIAGLLATASILIYAHPLSFFAFVAGILVGVGTIVSSRTLRRAEWRARIADICADLRHSNRAHR